MAAFLSAVVMILGTCMPAIAEVTELTTARVVVTEEARSPAATSEQIVELPYAPRGQGRLPLNATVWFELPFERPAEPDDLVLYLWRHNVSAEIFLNGESIGGLRDEGWFDPIGWNQPILLSLPAAALEANNVVQVALSTGPFGGMLSSVLIGPRTTLEPLYETRKFWQVETSRIGFFVSFLMGLFTLFLWLRRRQDRMYLLFSGAAFSWSVITLYLFLDVMPMPLVIWLGIVHTAGTWCTYFLVKFMLQEIERPMPRFEVALFWISVAATIAHFAVPRAMFFYFAYGFHLLGIGALLFLGVVLMIDAARRPGRASTWFSLGYIGMASLVARDWYYFIASPREDWVQASNMMHLGIPLLLLVIFVHLVNRFVRALDEAETLNRELEDRVERSRRALEASFEENRQMELLQSATREREKIYRDLHDDVGSKLVNIVHSGESERDISLARAALESLREAIYRANYQDQPIDRFLADLREEVELRLGAAGMELHWEEAILVRDIIISSESCYHVSRSCRELVSNILHHSYAKLAAFRIDQPGDGKSIVISLTDNGKGFCPESEAESAAGNGLGNVRHRLSTIGGEVRWESTPGNGTRVVLSFPLQQPVPSAVATQDNVPDNTMDASLKREPAV